MVARFWASLPAVCSLQTRGGGGLMMPRLHEVFVLAVSVLVSTGCVVGDSPQPGIDVGSPSTAGGSPDPGVSDPGNPCLLQAGTYHEVYTKSDASCAEIAAQDVTIGSTG